MYKLTSVGQTTKVYSYYTTIFNHSKEQSTVYITRDLQVHCILNSNYTITKIEGFQLVTFYCNHFVTKYVTFEVFMMSKVIKHAVQTSFVNFISDASHFKDAICKIRA